MKDSEDDGLASRGEASDPMARPHPTPIDGAPSASELSSFSTANALATIVAEEGELLFRFALRATAGRGSVEDAQDLVGALWSYVLERADRFKNEQHVRATLWQKMVKACLDWARKRTRRDRFISSSEEADGLDAHPLPDDLTETRRGLTALLAAIDSLPPEQRHAWELFELEGHTQREIAEQLEIAQGTVASRIAQAKQKLKAHFEGLRHTVPPESCGESAAEDAFGKVVE